jgi:hypothetical protein
MDGKVTLAKEGSNLEFSEHFTTALSKIFFDE